MCTEDININDHMLLIHTTVYKVESLLFVFAMNLCIHQGIILFPRCVCELQKEGDFIKRLSEICLSPQCKQMPVGN